LYKNFVRIGETFCNHPFSQTTPESRIVTRYSWLISTTTHAWPVFNECLFDSYDSYTIHSYYV